jgi:type IV pilus assembly protein PilW
MNTLHPPALRRAASCERGFTLIELLVTMAIAVFLIFGLVTVVENVRQANLNQTTMSLVQDEQRFAMTILTDVIQAGGYYPNPVPPATTPVWTPTTSLAAAYASPQGYTFPAGVAFAAASHVNGTPDKFGVRYRTNSGDGVILCDGSTNNTGASAVYANQFSVVPAAGNTPAYLECQLNGNAVEPLVYGISSMTVYYGVNRTAPSTNYNVDTYLTSDQMTAADWDNITAIRVVLQFPNPLYNAGNPQGQAQFLTFERVVQVMGRAGLHS